MTAWLWEQLFPILFWAWFFKPGTITPLENEA